MLAGQDVSGRKQRSSSAVVDLLFVGGSRRMHCYARYLCLGLPTCLPAFFPNASHLLLLPQLPPSGVSTFVTAVGGRHSLPDALCLPTHSFLFLLFAGVLSRAAFTTAIPTYSASSSPGSRAGMAGLAVGKTAHAGRLRLVLACLRVSLSTAAGRPTPWPHHTAFNSYRRRLCDAGSGRAAARLTLALPLRCFSNRCVRSCGWLARERARNSFLRAYFFTSA